MLMLSTELHDKPITITQTGDVIGRIDKPIINPNNLHVDGFYCTDLEKNQLILLDTNLGSFSHRGIAIDNIEYLSDPGDLMQLKPVVKINFTLIGKSVFAGKKKIGKVTDYATDKNSLFIQKLYVKPPIWSAMGSSRLTINRTCVIEISHSRILISGPEQRTFAKTNLSPTLD